MRVERIGLATLYLGDCRDILPILPMAKVIATDPPYGIGYVTNYRKVSDTPAMLANDATAPLWCVDAMADRLQEGGALYLCTSLAVMDQWRAAITAAGLTVKTPIIWDKGNWTAGDLDGDFGNQVEPVLFAHKGRHTFTGGRKANLWPVARPVAGEHPTPKPVGLMAGMIECSSRPGELVIDPFMGEGPTGVAAVRSGRIFIGCEIEARYFATACRRIEEAQRQGDMFGAIGDPYPRHTEALA